MPFDYRIEPDERLAYVTARGSVDMRSSLEAMGELARNPSWNASFGVLIDLREMTYRPSLGELRVIAWALGHEKTAFPKRVAVVVSESVKRTRARVYDRFGRMAGFGLQLFPSMEDALDWLRETAATESHSQ